MSKVEYAHHGPHSLGQFDGLVFGWRVRLLCEGWVA